MFLKFIFPIYPIGPNSTNCNVNIYLGININKRLIRTQVKDVCGNGYTVSTTKSLATANITKPTITADQTTWVNTKVEVKINYTDKTGAYTGLTWEYKVGSGDWTKTTNNPHTVYVDTAGTKVCARQYDASGQGQSSEASIVIQNIDKEGPTGLDFVLEKTSDLSLYTFNTWSNSLLQVRSFYAADPRRS